MPDRGAIKENVIQANLDLQTKKKTSFSEKAVQESRSSSYIHQLLVRDSETVLEPFTETYTIPIH